MKRTMLVTTALIVSTVAAPSPAVAESARSAPPTRGLAAPIRAAVPVDVSPVKVSIGRFGATPSTLTYRTYVRGTDGRVWFRDLSTAGAPTSDWRPLSGVVASGPDVVPNAARTAHVLAARSTSGSLIIRDVQPNGVASAWRDLGGKLTSAPALALYSDDSTVTVAARGTDGAAWIRVRRGGVWQAWRPAGGQLTSAPDLMGLGSVERFVISVRGLNGRVWFRYLSLTGAAAGTWQPTAFDTSSAVSTWWAMLGGIPSGIGPGYDYRGADDALYAAANGAPVPPTARGGQLSSAPDRDNPGGSRSNDGPDGEIIRLIVARDAANSLALYDTHTNIWTNLGGTLT